MAGSKCMMATKYEKVGKKRSVKAGGRLLASSTHQPTGKKTRRKKA